MSISKTTTENDQTTARRALSRFVLDRAERTTDELGFGWVGVATAPSTYPQLRAAFHQSQRTGRPLPVSRLQCARTVFETPDVNIAFRFWHDTAHCRLGLSFELPDEWELALWHLDELHHAGFSTNSAEYQLLRDDLLGQLILLGVSGRFPFDQRDFTLTCGVIGLDVGILTELRRIS